MDSSNHTSRLWQDVNQLRWSAFTTGKADKSRITSVIERALQAKDPDLLRCVKELVDQLESIDFNTRFLWLTSFVCGTTYPPLPVDKAGDYVWNEFKAKQGLTDEQAKRFCRQGLLTTNGTCKIQQNSMISDCSLVSSLINVKRYAPGGFKIRKLYNSPKYQINLHFNGSRSRLVCVDSSNIPTDANGAQLSVWSGAIEDKLVELAYLQVKNGGSYDYHGSNTAIDTFLISGFIPEILKVADCTFAKLASFWKTDACLIALGTASNIKGNDIQLLAGHDYPVSSLTDKDEIVIRDPLDPTKVFSLNWENVIQNFETIYLNWDATKLFAHYETLHFRYDSQKSNKFPSIIDKPILKVTNKSNRKEVVWLLLEGHLCEKQDGNSISFLEEVPNSVFSKFSTTGNNTGLYLKKITLEEHSSSLLFCHSNISSNYTIHLHSISSQITIKTSKLDFVTSVKSRWNDANSYGSFANTEYFKNPTFKLLIESDETNYIQTSLQLLTSLSSLINLQIYYADDHSLSKPVAFDGNYNIQMFNKQGVSILTNTPYKIICSTYNKGTFGDFKLLVSKPPVAKSITLEETFTRYGGHRYHTHTTFRWRTQSNRIKIFLNLTKATDMYISIFPMELQPSLSMRCNIFTQDTHEHLLRNTDFRSDLKYGYVIPHFLARRPTTIVLLIEKDGPFEWFSGLQMRVEIGSNYKITLNE